MAVDIHFYGAESGDNRGLQSFSGSLVVMGGAGADAPRTGDFFVRSQHKAAATGTSFTFPNLTIGTGLAALQTVRARMRFAMRIKQHVSATVNVASIGTIGNSPAGAFCLNSSGNYAAQSRTTRGTFSAGALALDTWYIVEMTVWSTRPGAGFGTINTEVTVIGFTTQTAADVGNISSYDIQPNSARLGHLFNFENTANTRIIDYDDWFYIGGAGTTDEPNVVLPAATHVAPVRITGQGASAQWTGDWNNCRDIPLFTSSTTEQSASGAGNDTTFTHDTLARLGYSGVAGFRLVTSLKVSSGSGVTHAMLINGVEYSTGASIGTSYSTPVVAYDMTVSDANFDSLTFGARNKSGTATQLGSLIGEALCVVGVGSHAALYPSVDGPKAKVGSYIGNGAFLSVTDVLFAADVILIKKRSGANNAGCFWHKGMGGTRSNRISSGGRVGDAVQAVTAIGFDLGSDTSVNQSGQTYDYVAWQDGGFGLAGQSIKYGTYLSNAVDGQTIVIDPAGWASEFLLIQGIGSTDMALRDLDHVGDASLLLGTSTTLADIIQSITATGFTVGAQSAVSSDLAEYSYISMKKTADWAGFFSRGVFAGTGATTPVIGTGFLPQFAVVDHDGVSDTARWRSSLHTGTNSHIWTTSSEDALGIISLDVDGFTVNAAMSESGKTSHWFAFASGAWVQPGCPPEVEFEDPNGDSTGLTWVEFEHVDEDGAPHTYVWSQVDLDDSTDYFGGFKDGRVISFGEITRGLSDDRGQLETTEFTFIISDHDHLMRGLLDTFEGKYLQNRMLVERMINDDARRREEIPRVLARGIVRGFKALDPLHFQFTGKDFMASKFGAGNIEKPIPGRRLAVDDFPQLRTNIVGQGVPIIYGHISDLEEQQVFVPDPPIPAPPGAVLGSVVGAAGSETYEYVYAVLPPPRIFRDGAPDLLFPDTTNPEHDTYHAGEVVIASVTVTNAPKVSEMVPGSRYVQLQWSNYSEGLRIALWGEEIALAGNACPRIYGRTPGGPWGLIGNMSHETATNIFRDDGRKSPKMYSQPPVVPNTGVIDGDATVPGTYVTVDHGKGETPVIYVGARDVQGVEWQEFLVCGHAIKEIEAWYCGGVRQPESTEGTDFLIPGRAGWIANIGADSYRDYNGNRYTVIYAKGTKADQAIDDSEPITLNLKGIETSGDGTGDFIEQIADIFKHFIINFGFQSYTSGIYLSSPEWGAGFDCQDDGPITQIDEASFDALKAVHMSRLDGGYPGGIIFGNYTGDINMRDAIARLNVSAGCESGFNRNSQFFVTIFDDNIAILNAANSYTQEENDIVKDSFNMDEQVDKVENQVVFNFRRRYTKTGFVATDAGSGNPDWFFFHQEITDQDSIDNLLETKRGPEQNFWAIRSFAVATDVAQRRLLYYKEPPRPVMLTTSLRGLTEELGNVVKVSHIGGIGPFGFVERPLRIIRFRTNPSQFTVTLETLDVERLYATGFILGDEVTLASSWSVAPTADRRYGYLCDEVTGRFSDGTPGKRLR